jgi:hypothetical protein
MQWIKNLFKPRQNVIHVTDIKDLFPYFDPDNFIIGWRRGTLNSENIHRLLNNEAFEFNGSPTDFIILPKQHIKEQTDGKPNQVNIQV